MDINSAFIELSTKGQTDIIDLTSSIQKKLADSGMQEGQLTVFAIGSTTGISTVEYEPGLVNHDLAEMFSHFAPYQKNYEHNKTWGDNNGASHLRSTLTGTSLTIPFIKGKLVLGTWQQIVFLDFDTKPRKRRVVVQLLGK